MKNKIQPWTSFGPATYSPDPEQHAKMMKSTDTHQLFKNNRYTVNVRILQDGWVHLSIKRNDREPIRDWRDLQRIKNEICGPEREGLELFPAESRLIDSANQFHLWVAPIGVKFPIGYDAGRLVAEKTDGGSKSKQRPFEDLPPDSATELVRGYEREAAKQFPVNSPEYFNCIQEQHAAFVKKQREEPEPNANPSQDTAILRHLQQ